MSSAIPSLSARNASRASAELWAFSGALVDALKRFEYRSYDSAGVATLQGGELGRRCAEGRLRNLEARLAASAGRGLRARFPV